MSRYNRWIIGLAVLLAGCAVKPMTPPAVDGGGQAGAAASPAPATIGPTTGAVPAGVTEAAPLAAMPVAAITAVTPSSAPATPANLPVSSATTGAVLGGTATPAASNPTPVVGSPTPALIVVADVPLVPAPTATRPAALSVVRPRTAAPTNAPASRPAEMVAPLSGDVAAAEQYTVDLINAKRAPLGLAPLAADATLMSIANSRVADMVARGYTGHNDPATGVALGPSLMRSAGFGGLVGENWYGSRLGPPTIADVAMKWFMTDRPHYQNILNPRYTGVGVGIAYNGQQWLLIQDFAGK